MRDGLGHSLAPVKSLQVVTVTSFNVMTSRADRSSLDKNFISVILIYTFVIVLAK